MNREVDIIEEYGIDFVARFACLYEGVNVACKIGRASCRERV